MSKPELPIPTQVDRVDPSGLGIGVGLAVSGTLLLLFPVVLPVDFGWQTFVLVMAVVVTVIGVGGFFFELAKHRDRPWISDIGTACVLFGLASALLIVHVRSEFAYLADLLLVLAMFGLAAFGIIGFCIGLAKGSQSRPVPVITSKDETTQPLAIDDRLRRNDRFNIGVAIGCTVVQCVVSVILAVFTARPS